MARIRTIDPHFPRTPNLSRVSREARLFFILLWTVADDSGRLRLDHERLMERLYPFDGDAPSLLPVWIGELEVARCVELYRVADVDYLRVRKWRQMQSIDRPTASRLPASPSETIREAREPREELPLTQVGRASKANPREEATRDTDDGETGDPNAITPERVLADLDIVLRKARRKEAPSSADARYLELAGRKTGLWNSRGAVGGPTEPEEKRSIGPAELMGLPDQRAGR
jgi:hypothetical protein